MQFRMEQTQAMELEREENANLLEMLADFEQGVSALCRKLGINEKQALLLSKLASKSKGDFFSSQLLADFFGKRHLDFLDEYLDDLCLLEEKKLIESSLRHNGEIIEYCFRIKLDAKESLAINERKRQEIYFGDRLKGFIADINRVLSCTSQFFQKMNAGEIKKAHQANLIVGATKVASDFINEIEYKLACAYKYCYFMHSCDDCKITQEACSGELLEQVNGFISDVNRVGNYANQLIQKTGGGGIKDADEAEFVSDFLRRVRYELWEAYPFLGKKK